MYWLINLRTKKYKKARNPSFNGNWPSRYKHLKGEKAYNVVAFKPWPFDCINGIPFEYSICRDGMIATLYVDKDLFSDADIKKAKHNLRNERDVVKLFVVKLTEIKRRKNV